MLSGSTHALADFERAEGRDGGPGDGPPMTLGEPVPSVSQAAGARERASEQCNRGVRAERAPTGAPRTAGNLGARPQNTSGDPVPVRPGLQAPRRVRWSRDRGGVNAAAPSPRCARRGGSIALQVLILHTRVRSSSPPRHQPRSTDAHPQSPSRRRNLPHASSSLRRIGLYLTHSCTYRSRAGFRPILITP